METHDASAHKISDFLSRAELHQLEGLYHGFLRLVDAEEQMIVVLPIASTEIPFQNTTDTVTDIVIALHRPKQNFSERDRLVLNLLRPHLLQAYKNASVFSQMQQELTQLHRMKEQLGMITLSINGNVQTMTQKAWAMLTHYFQDSWTQGFHLPELLQHWVKYQISSTRNDVTQLHPPLQIAQETKCLIVRLICDRPQEQYVLMLEEQPSNWFSPKVLEMLGLTKREAEVLFWGANDKSTKEIASILGCREKTVEKHFEHIYEKFGVQTRMAATMKALSNLGIIHSINSQI
ncbi:helix-turn-helix transcriptional regulator [Leptolyngbya sp. 7M]|uniref:helix-turn-helix transcriptional regulator n=1 Tax=Leptolyngbya sp. 7M TaxID=2812896 RepID=UPI001B8CB7A2|nr:LuxR family transcriptional regulator [Leptolyngbya sp. 7M]QYO68179.1 LuxR family transcriptional regulator [Leptolyngbya sp. 7M]